MFFIVDYFVLSIKFLVNSLGIFRRLRLH